MAVDPACQQFRPLPGRCLLPGQEPRPQLRLRTQYQPVHGQIRQLRGLSGCCLQVSRCRVRHGSLQQQRAGVTAARRHGHRCRPVSGQRRYRLAVMQTLQRRQHDGGICRRLQGRVRQQRGQQSQQTSARRAHARWPAPGQIQRRHHAAAGFTPAAGRQRVTVSNQVQSPPARRQSALPLLLPPLLPPRRHVRNQCTTRVGTQGQLGRECRGHSRRRHVVEQQSGSLLGRQTRRQLQADAGNAIRGRQSVCGQQPGHLELQPLAGLPVSTPGQHLP